MAQALLIVVYPPPSADLGPSTVKDLDDQFFTSDPYAYIRSRILMLLATDRAPLTGGLADEFTRLLGPSSAQYSACDDRTTNLQIAVDAFALRHQVAETLLRMLHVAMHHQAGQSHWVELIDTPTRSNDVIAENRRILDSQEDQGHALIRRVLGLPERTLPTDQRPVSEQPPSPDPRAESSDSAQAEGALGDTGERALGLHVSWINYAIRLFVQQAPDLDAAHNKFKHGMGLRPQDDVLSTLTLTPPDQDGNVPLSALTGDRALNLFGGITTEYLARASRKHGIEATQIAMLPGPTLVEAAAMAHTMALIFHSAAVRHFADHELHEGRAIPNHPGLLLDGPKPGTLRRLQPFAMRFPLTTPLRPRSNHDPMLFWTNGDIQTMRFGERMSGVVIDDGDTSLHDSHPATSDAHT